MSAQTTSPKPATRGRTRVAPPVSRFLVTLPEYRENRSEAYAIVDRETRGLIAMIYLDGDGALARKYQAGKESGRGHVPGAEPARTGRRPRGDAMTNTEREQRGVAIINSYIDRENDRIGACEAATDAIADILHAYCERDELEAEKVLSLARIHFVAEVDEEAPCSECPEIVTADDPYFVTPCGSFCLKHMRSHVQSCRACAGEFREDFAQNEEA